MKIVIILSLFLIGCDRCIDGILYHRNGDIFVKTEKKCLTINKMNEKQGTSEL